MGTIIGIVCGCHVMMACERSNGQRSSSAALRTGRLFVPVGGVSLVSSVGTLRRDLYALAELANI